MRRRTPPRLSPSVSAMRSTLAWRVPNERQSLTPPRALQRRRPSRRQLLLQRRLREHQRQSLELLGLRPLWFPRWLQRLLRPQ